MRLIPVSSVGPEFAVPDPAVGMRKTGRSPRPQNVEVPLTGILPDFLRLAVTAGRAVSDEAVPEAVAERSAFGRWTGIAIEVGLVHLHPAFRMVPPHLVDEAVAYAERAIRDHLGRRRAVEAAPTDQERRAVRDEQSALSLVSRQCIHMIEEFEREYPAPVLDGGMSVGAEDRTG